MVFHTPEDVLILRPADHCTGEAYLPWLAAEKLQYLHFVTQGLVGNRHRMGHAQHISDLKARNCQRCGQPAVEQALLETLFTAQDIELRTLFDQIDTFAAAQYFHTVDRQIAFVGEPAKRDRALLHQSLRIVDTRGAIGIARDYTVFEPVLPICNQLRWPVLELRGFKVRLLDPCGRFVIQNNLARERRICQTEGKRSAGKEWQAQCGEDRFVVHAAQLTDIAIVRNSTSTNC